MTRIDGSTVLLTGATGGLGQAVARGLAARGAKLILTGRRVDVLEPLAEELGGRAIAADLSDRDAVLGLVTEAGEVDILVANAGVPAMGTLEDLSLDEIDRMLSVNLGAPIALAKLLAEPMVARGRGHLVFMSSLSGKSAQALSSLYSATKFGLRGFALSLREDLHGTGVGVSTVLPGFISEAGMFAEANIDLPFGMGTRSPQDVCRAVVRAIERDRAEIEVGAPAVRAGAALSTLFPQLSASVARRFGAYDVAAALAAGHRKTGRR